MSLMKRHNGAQAARGVRGEALDVSRLEGLEVA